MRYLSTIIIGVLIGFNLSGQSKNNKDFHDLLMGDAIDTIKLQCDFNAQLEYGVAVKHIVYQTEIKDLNDSIANSNTDDLFGPYFKNDSVIFYKSISIDSMRVARVGNIWLSKDRGLDNAKQIAENILQKVKAGEDFDTFCILYSDDRNTRKNCDIGWFYYSSMVEPFSEEVFKHKKGDLFIVQTRYGYHVVKMLDNIKLERKTMKYIKITVPNKGYIPCRG